MSQIGNIKASVIARILLTIFLWLSYNYIEYWHYHRMESGNWEGHFHPFSKDKDIPLNDHCDICFYSSIHILSEIIPSSNTIDFKLPLIIIEKSKVNETIIFKSHLAKGRKLTRAPPLAA